MISIVGLRLWAESGETKKQREVGYLLDVAEAAQAAIHTGELTERGVLLHDIGAATDLQIALAYFDFVTGSKARS